MVAPTLREPVIESQRHAVTDFRFNVGVNQYESLGKRLKRLRGNRPRAEIAELADMPYTTLQYLEDHESDKTEVCYLPRLADALKVTLRELVTGEKEQEDQGQDIHLRPHERHVVEIMRSSTNACQRILDHAGGVLQSRPSRRGPRPLKSAPKAIPKKMPAQN